MFIVEVSTVTATATVRAESQFCQLKKSLLANRQVFEDQLGKSGFGSVFNANPGFIAKWEEVKCHVVSLFYSKSC